MRSRESDRTKGDDLRIRSVSWVLVALALFGCGCFEEVNDDDWRLVFAPFPIEGELSEITDLKFFPGSSEFLALNRKGTAYHYHLGDEKASLLGSFRIPHAQPSWDCGLIEAVFDPDFAKNHFIFVSTCMGEQSAGIVRITYLGDPRAVAASARIILKMKAPEGKGQLHRMGGLGFEPGGVMWALVGDMNSPSDAQNVENEMGSLVRLIPGRDPDRGGYDVPEGNAFSLESPSSPLIYAWGFRMPWRGALDSHGRYWVGDVGGFFGEQGYEEVNLVTRKGQNFGWPREIGPPGDPVKEGALEDAYIYWDREDDHPYILEDPESDPEHLSTNRGRVAWVGGPYRPNSNDRYEGRLYDRILYGDLCAGFLRGIELDAPGQVEFHRNIAHMPFISSMDQAPDGYLYAMRMGGCTSDTAEDGGALYRVELTREPPPKRSEPTPVPGPRSDRERSTIRVD